MRSFELIGRKLAGIISIVTMSAMLMACGQSGTVTDDIVKQADEDLVVGNAESDAADAENEAEEDDMTADSDKYTDGVGNFDADQTAANAETADDEDIMDNLAIPVETVESADWNYDEILASEAAIADETKQGIEEAFSNNITAADIAAIQISGEQGAVKYMKCYTSSQGQKENIFAVFAGSDDTTVFVTPDNTYITANMPIVDTTREEVACDFAEKDFDNDGVDELGMVVRTLHGSGYFENALFVLDKESASGKWSVYHMTPEWFTKEILKRAKFDIENNIVKVSIDGEVCDSVERTMTGEVSMSLEQLVEIEISGDSFEMTNTPAYFNDDDEYGMFDSGKDIKLEIEYKGDGVFECIKCSMK